MIKTDIIETLGLFENEQEGGYLSPTYEADLAVPDNILPGFELSGDARKVCNAIYYYLGADDVSVMHRVKGDMLYHFYRGDAVELFLLDCRGGSCRPETFTLGIVLEAGQRPVKKIPGGVWLGSRIAPGGTEALMGVTMAPGFHPADYEIGSRDDLVRQCQGEWAKIVQFSRPSSHPDRP